MGPNLVPWEENPTIHLSMSCQFGHAAPRLGTVRRVTTKEGRRSVGVCQAVAALWTGR